MSLNPPRQLWKDLRELVLWCSQQRPQDRVIVTVTDTSYSVGPEDVVLVDDDAAGAAVTINLPSATTNKGRVKHIKKLGSTGNVTVDGSGLETIDEATTNVLTTQYGVLIIVSDGTEWWTL